MKKIDILQRRSFIKNSTLTVISVSAFGGLNWNGKSFEGNTPTTTDILGPFYRPGAPLRSNIIPAGSTGIPLNLGGTIFKDDGKTFLKDALVEIWQCDENKYYDNISDDFLFRGAVKTNNKGKYNFKTIVPVPYQASPGMENSWRPAHIHMRVSSASQQDLITQIYLKNGEYVDKDRSSSSPDAVNRLLPITKNVANENLIIFDIVMRKEFPLEQEVYRKITGLYGAGDNIFEFVQSDDLLWVKKNGQYISGVTHAGNNTFEGPMGSPKISFELIPGGGVKATIVFETTTLTAMKFLKY